MGSVVGNMVGGRFWGRGKYGGGFSGFRGSWVSSVHVRSQSIRGCPN